MSSKKGKNKMTRIKKRNSEQSANLSESSGNELTPNVKNSDPIILEELTVRVCYSDDSSITSIDRLDLMRFIRRNLKDRPLSHESRYYKFVYNEKSINIEVLIGTNNINNSLEASFDIKSPNNTLSRKMNDSLENSFQSLSLSKNKSTQNYMITNNTKLRIESENIQHLAALEDIAGYQNQIKALRNIISLPLSETSKLKAMGKLRTPRTVLVFGPQGTGKTMTINALMNEYCAEMSCIEIDCGDILSKSVEDSISKLKIHFAAAIEESPSLLFLDNIELIGASRKSSTDTEKRIISKLVSLLDKIPNDKHVIIIAVTSKVDSLDMSLRRPGRLDREIEFHVPLPSERLAILRKHLNKSNCDISDDQLLSLAESAHGFTGADLALACREALLLVLESNANLITGTDLQTALKFVRPSAMREVTLEVPHVYWRDIAGMDKVKKRLLQSVVWPLKNSDSFERMGIEPPRGVLMYGPPGCCKTMIGKALATESGLNFIAIKGPELFSKWVGESERAVREVFRRAKLASPSILFFDEIDALTAERGGGQSSVGDRVLTQILTEIDGIEKLKGVVIVAATNRPDMIDKALLRPGRLDSIIYVPLPDLQTRFELFKIRTRKMPLDFELPIDKELLSLADKTDGYTGAEISAVCQEAALFALECDLNCAKLNFHHFITALTIVKPRISQQMITFYESYECNNINDFTKNKNTE